MTKEQIMFFCIICLRFIHLLGLKKKKLKKKTMKNGGEKKANEKKKKNRNWETKIMGEK
jgi:hypothetical protein